MSKPQNFAELLSHDKRYKREAYGFVFEGLRYAHEVMGLGTAVPSDESVGELPREAKVAKSAVRSTSGEGEESDPPRHLTGRELCEAIRLYALDQFGFMAKTVLNTWGVYKTRDFGNIVFNLIEIGEMSKTKDDRQEDFDDVFDFDAHLQQEFKIETPKSSD
jgi:uncharacterized repeat protein (TIGR04138 family)